jgi:carboxypeptidase Q
MKRTTCSCLFLLVMMAGLAGQQSPADTAALAKIRDEGMNRSKVTVPFDMFVNVIGPRLTGSPAHKRAADYAQGLLDQWGMTNAHLEPWEFGRGWELQKLTIEMVEPRYMPLIGYAEAWTPSTPGEIVVNAVSTAGKTADEIAAMPIAGAAVLTQPVITNFIDKDRDQPTLVADARTGAPPAPRQGGAGSAGAAAGGAGGATGGRSANAAGVAGAAGQRRSGAAVAPVGQSASAVAAGAAVPAGQAPGRGAVNAATAKAAVIIKPSLGIDGTVFVQAGRDNPANTQPAIVLASEHYNIIARLLAHNIPVKLRVNVQTRFYDTDKNSYNVIADIPGTDPALKGEVVMLGAHLDSWHAGTGATDNADGVAEVMEAFRLIKASGLQPRRTLRLAIWSGEEQGLLGSQQYVTAHLAGDAHKAERDKMDVYFNIDPGTGPIYGWYMENNAAAKPIFDAWLEPLKDLGMRSNVIQGIPSTDHLSFRPVNVPAFNPIQEYADYDVREHHTNVDTAERVDEKEMKQASIVLAWFAYSAAMRTERIPAAAAGDTSGRGAAAVLPSASSSAVVPTTRAETAVVVGYLWTGDAAPIVNGRIQLRHVPSGLIEDETTSDAKGQFHFDTVPAGNYNVTYVSEKGALIGIGKPFAAQPGESVATFVRLDAQLPPVTGRAADAAPAAARSPQLAIVVGYLREGSSKPIGDAAVQLRDAKTNAIIASMRTGPRGEFQFPNIAPGTYVVVEVADKDQKQLATGDPFIVSPGQAVTNFIRVKGKAIR